MSQVNSYKAEISFLSSGRIHTHQKRVKVLIEAELLLSQWPFVPSSCHGAHPRLLCRQAGIQWGCWLTAWLTRSSLRSLVHALRRLLVCELSSSLAIHFIVLLSRWIYMLFLFQLLQLLLLLMVVVAWRAQTINCEHVFSITVNYKLVLQKCSEMVIWFKFMNILPFPGQSQSLPKERHCCPARSSNAPL